MKNRFRKLVACYKILFPSTELDRTRNELANLKEKYETLLSESDHNQSNSDKYERLYKDEKANNEQLTRALERSQIQEKKIYDRLRKEKRHQQKLWAEMIQNDIPVEIRDLNTSRSSLDLDSSRNDFLDEKNYEV